MYDNERRKDDEMRRLFDAIERVGKDCQDQHEETQKSLDDITKTQTGFGVKIQGIESTLDRIGSKVDTTSERTASTETMLSSLRRQNSEQYGRISEIEGELKVLSEVKDNDPEKPFTQTDNFKWLIGAGGFVSLLVLLAFGAITAQDVKDLAP